MPEHVPDIITAMDFFKVEVMTFGPVRYTLEQIDARSDLTSRVRGSDGVVLDNPVWSDDGAQGDATVLIQALGAAPTSYCGEAARTTPMLTLSKIGGESVELQWGASCVASDTDYGIYAGPIGDFTAHVPVVCSTGGATSTSVVLPDGDVYYLVAPNNQFLEGIYGSDSSGTQIPAGPTRCYPRATGTGCPAEP